MTYKSADKTDGKNNKIVNRFIGDLLLLFFIYFFFINFQYIKCLIIKNKHEGKIKILLISNSIQDATYNYISLHNKASTNKITISSCYNYYTHSCTLYILIIFHYQH